MNALKLVLRANHTEGVEVSLAAGNAITRIKIYSLNGVQLETGTRSLADLQNIEGLLS